MPCQCPSHNHNASSAHLAYTEGSDMGDSCRFASLISFNAMTSFQMPFHRWALGHGCLEPAGALNRSECRAAQGRVEKSEQAQHYMHDSGQKAGIRSWVYPTDGLTTESRVPNQFKAQHSSCAINILGAQFLDTARNASPRCLYPPWRNWRQPEAARHPLRNKSMIVYHVPHPWSGWHLGNHQI